MKPKEKSRIYLGGMILVALGILILLNSTGTYVFSKSWPILLIVISASVLLQNWKEMSGWFIGVVGLILLIEENWLKNISEITKFGMPLILVAIGLFFMLRGLTKGRR